MGISHTIVTHRDGVYPHPSNWDCFGAFLIISVGITVGLWNIFSHLTHYTIPVLQRNIVRILFLAPIYGGESSDHDGLCMCVWQPSHGCPWSSQVTSSYSTPCGISGKPW
eukprot:Blabericola_migrator_1__2129@NODE_1588_length_4223_cov_110_912175_g1038_i0_p7_GENE_NODE_1588_length_4223_cov_110_912175_g1038_i0NODE_1588_length_4223_cov_110_912175_g1038_i0_p7_ORF_typecomplete_len110_score3_04Solute_trans_a/PF03619_16/2_6e09_NODE_1588_length_4223_cov_110_912175_g1038_i017952124